MEWIKTADRLPTESGACIVYCQDGYESKVDYSAKWEKFNAQDWSTEAEVAQHCFNDVTHWMPMPEPPKE